MTATPSPQSRINIIQGEYAVSRKKDEVITTLLGSCVAVCMHDPVVRVGGMNHFLLPGTHPGSDKGASARMGVHLMELLINGLFKLGASRSNLQAKLFGGARTIKGLSDIGGQNVAFSQEFLVREGIKVLPGSTGGTLGRRLQFWPETGRAFQHMMIYVEEAPVIVRAEPKTASRMGEVELF